MIELKNIRIGYSDGLLTAEHIQLESGNVYILVGKNGAGKSTLLKTLSKQIPLLSGEINLNNKALSAVTARELPKEMAFVPVHFPHMDYVRTREFISAGRAPYTNALGRLNDLDEHEIESAIATLEIQYLSNRFTSELSDGEKQLAAIAKAVAQKTSIILLDEPTAFLDYSNKKKVLEILKETAQSLDKCIVLSAHDIDLCLEFASHFLIVDSKSKALKLFENPSKAEIIDVAFGEGK